MDKRVFTTKEWIYYAIRTFFIILCIIPNKIANWATDKINNSYYKLK